MKRKRAMHSERVRARWQINNQPYPDNPNRLPFDNLGNLVDPVTRKAPPRWKEPIRN